MVAVPRVALRDLSLVSVTHFLLSPELVRLLEHGLATDDRSQDDLAVLVFAGEISCLEPAIQIDGIEMRPLQIADKGARAPRL